MKLDANIEKALDELIESIQASKVYDTFESNRRIAMNDYDIRNKINRTRAIRSQLEHMSDYEKNGDMAENLIDEYTSLVDVTAVHEFSVAEHEMCELYQIITKRLSKYFDTDL